MFARAEQGGRHGKHGAALDRLDRHARGDPAMKRDFDHVVGGLAQRGVLAGAALVARARDGALVARLSGSRITSRARARLGRRRMKPRSSSAEIRRWTPDFDLRSSAPSFPRTRGDAGRIKPRLNEREQFVLLARKHPQVSFGERMRNE
jgi:hypothetical protein